MKRYLFKHKKLFLINIFFVIINSALITFFAFVIKELIDVSISKDLERFFSIASLSIVYILLMLISSYLRRIFFAKFMKENMISLKNDLFSKLLNRSKRKFNSENTANYISIINNDVQILERGYFMNFLVIIQAILSFCIAVFGLFRLNIYIASSILLLSIIPVFVPYIFANKLSKAKKRYSDNLSSFVKNTKDFLLGFDVIKSFNMKNKIFNQYNNSNTNVEEAKYKFSTFNAAVDFITDIFSYLAHFIALGLGTYLVIKDRTTVGTFVASIQLMEYISAPVRNISYIISSFKSVGLIGKKVVEIIDEDVSDDYGIRLEQFRHSIEFNNLSFSYDEKPTLKDISFKVHKGEKIAIVGQSGSGKSTILKLLLKYYNDFQGEILIDNLDTKNISTSSIYNLISVIQQDVFMFDTSIKNNITLFENYDSEEIDRVIDTSGLRNFIDDIDNNLDSTIGENGCSISGGEKQRIAIARALIKDTPILALDEATASLDNNTSYIIEKTLLDLKDLTLLVVTHKLSEKVLQKYDKIIVLKDGVIQEIGDFSRLIDNKGYFYELYSLEKLNEAS